MAKVMASGKVDPELWEWATAYAVERGVSRSSLLEAGLRELQASAMGGVPDLPVASAPAAAPVVGGTFEDGRTWMQRRQAALNKSRGL